MQNALSSTYTRSWLIGITLFAFVYPGPSIYGQPMQFGVRNGALANASIGLPVVGLWNLNPAHLGYLDAGVLSFHAVQPYGLAEMRFGSIHLAVPANPGAFMLNVSSLGFESYRQTQSAGSDWRCPCALAPSRRLILAAHGTLQHLAIQQYGRAHAYSLTLGTSVKITPSLFFGATARHFLQPANNIALPRALGLGLAYHPFPAGWVMLAAEQQQTAAPSLKLGVEGQANLLLRASIWIFNATGEIRTGRRYFAWSIEF